MNAPGRQPRTTPSFLAPDPALPQRDLLLDEKQVTARLSSILYRHRPIVIEHCETQRIKYRVVESLRLLYRIRIDGVDRLITARAIAQRPHRDANRVIPPNLSASLPWSKEVHDPEISTTFRSYPHDRNIKNLELLTEPRGTQSTALGARWHSSEVVAYAPEKCATAKCVDQDGNVLAYAKMYAGKEGQRISQTYQELVAFGLPISRTLDYQDHLQLLLLEAVSGRRIADLKDGEQFEGMANLAETLARLHLTSVPKGLTRYTRLDPVRLQQCATIISKARPDVSQIVNELARELCSTLPVAEPFVCLHGDVHPKNGIVNEGKATLIDFDQASVGVPAADLCSLLALLHYNWRVGFVCQSDSQELTETFLRSYSQFRKLPAAYSLRWDTPAALLAERALRSVNRVRPEGLLHLPQLLMDALAMLKTGGEQL